jgi:hypothetical protein
MPDGRAKVVTVGAGFGGIEAAKSLRCAPVEAASIEEAKAQFLATQQRVTFPPGPRIQRNSKAESLLPGCALGPPKCPSNFPRRRLLPSESIQFANVYGIHVEW